MKVLQVIPYFFVSWAGGRTGHPVETVYGLSRELVNRGHEVTVYTTDAFNKVDKTDQEVCDIEVEGIRVREFRSIGKSLGMKHHIVYAPSMAPALERDTTQYDVIHLLEYRTLPNITAYHYAIRHRIPYVLQAHGAAQRFEKSNLKHLYDWLWGYRILRKASKLLASNAMEAEQYRSLGATLDRIEVVANGIDLARFARLPRRGIFREKLGISEKKVVLFLGRIARVKGVDLLIRAFSRLVMQVDNAHLVIAGPDDGDLSRLKGLVHEMGLDSNVTFSAALYGNDKLSAYLDADVYVLPSTYDNFGITVLEAITCGTPVIVTDRVGLAEDIRGRAGLVVPREEESLVRALHEILTDDNLRREFISQGRKLVEEKFTWQKVAAKMESVYHSARGAK